MKIRKILALIFNIMLVCSLFVFTNVSASAQTEMGLEFSLTNENGESVITVNPGDEITVYFNMKRTDSSENYKTNGFQNYIHYDLSFFELVDGTAKFADADFSYCGCPRRRGRQGSAFYFASLHRLALAFVH